MPARRAFALLPLAAAAILYVAQFGAQLPSFVSEHWFQPSPRFDIPKEHQEAARPLQELIRGHPQRQQLGSFYAALAELLPKLPPETTGTQFRAWLEKSVQFRFAGQFQQLPGLSQAIHGSDGVIAKIYGMESGKLDVPKMQAALRAVAWACQ